MTVRSTRVFVANHSPCPARPGPRLALLLGAAAAFCIPAVAAGATPEPTYGPSLGDDDRPHPLGTEQRALRREALEEVLKAGTSDSDKVHRVANGQYVELAREGEDLIFTMLVDFGDTISSDYGGAPGPRHNEIAEPNRDTDNVTSWTEDFDPDWYQELLFSEGTGALSMRDYYIEVSSNRYAVDGDVTDWVTLDNNLAYYGTNSCGSIWCVNNWWMVQDAADVWYDAQLDAGSTPAEIDAYLSQFDLYDRYDWDGDGVFDEPDGYIDHFQLVHAGIGEEVDGGTYGSDAIWSHSWYAFNTDVGYTGPSSEYLLGGARIGDSSYWIGSYTTGPENGGVGIFAHEFAHDLGLPDLYDLYGENSTAFWTLMSAGSYTSNGTESFDNLPVHMGAWEKLQFGWLDYEVAYAGEKSEHKLGPSTTTTKAAQAVLVMLPDNDVYLELGEPYAGDHFYYSGKGNYLNNVMWKLVYLEADSTLEAKVRYDIEADWDYAYLAVSTGGYYADVVQTNLSSGEDPNGSNIGLAGITGSTDGEWVDLSASLADYEGWVYVGFYYITDQAIAGDGFSVDELAITGQATDGAEADEPWILYGFSVAEETTYLGSFFNAYLAEYRQYTGFDAGLETGPYVVTEFDRDAGTLWMEHYAYQDGLLVTYWNEGQPDNNVSQHPGEGLILPIDAHPDVMTDLSPREQSYDSTFGLDDTDPFVITYGGTVLYASDSQDAVSVFDDTEQYWREDNPSAGVINPHTGTQIRVKSTSAHDTFMQVEVRPTK